MALNHKELVSLPHESRPYKRGLGGGLFVLVDKEYKGKDGSTIGGRKYFKGRVKGEEIWIGTFGNKAGEYSLAEARSKFHDIKDRGVGGYKWSSERIPVPRRGSVVWGVNDHAVIANHALDFVLQRFAGLDVLSGESR